MPNRDVVLLETVKTHRARLRAAFVFGQLDERRVTNDNLKRLVGSIVLAAVVCAVCVGVAFVHSLRAGQAATALQQAGLGPATGPAFAADTFDRRVRAGWGTAELGGGWRLAGAAAGFAVADGAASLDVATGQTRGADVGPLQDRSDLSVTVQRTVGARDGGVALAVQGRRISRTQAYSADTRLGADGSVSLVLVRRIPPGPSGEPPVAALSDTVTLRDVTGSTDRPPAAVSVRVQVAGTNPTTIRAKAWPAGGAEPQSWTVTASDSTPELQRPGTIGLLGARTTPGRPARLAVLDVVARVAP